MIKAWELDANFKDEIAREPGGEHIKRCFQCSTCTLGCPITEIVPEYNPRKIIQKALLGMKKEVLESDEIWLCSVCQTCYAWCPQDVRFSEVIRAIKRVAEKEAEKGNIKIKSGKPLFDKAFLNQIKKYGRLHEVGLIRDYMKMNKELKLMEFAKNFMGLGITQFKKGKFKLFPSKIKGDKLAEVKRIFEKIGE
ncbi:MAG: 4Fe-4S dicluster domain-containing protein [Candidatus Methanospirareceae archaeon]